MVEAAFLDAMTRSWSPMEVTQRLATNSLSDMVGTGEPKPSGAGHRVLWSLTFMAAMGC